MELNSILPKPGPQKTLDNDISECQMNQNNVKLSQKIGDKGATETSCSSSAGWTVSNDNLISCARKCLLGLAVHERPD